MSGDRRPPDQPPVRVLLVDDQTLMRRGEVVLGAVAAERLVSGLRTDGGPVSEQTAGDAPDAVDAVPGGGRLSEREREVARLVGRGVDNVGIARRLYLTEGTVKNHVANIRRKLGLRDRTQLAVWMNRHYRADAD